MRIKLTLNGEATALDIDARECLSDTLRECCGLTSVHLGCEHGACGACTVSLNGKAARSCLILTAACADRSVITLDGTLGDPLMQRLQRNFHERHALQCGFCTPGMLMAAYDLLRRRKNLSEADVRHALAGQICRCTGYVGIVDAILDTQRDTQDLAAAQTHLAV